MLENQVGKKVLVLVFSALIGGGVGFLTAHLFIRRLEQMEEEQAHQLEFDFVKAPEEIYEVNEKKFQPSKTDYSSIPQKPSLSDLALKYTPQESSLDDNPRGTTIIPEEMWMNEDRMGKTDINFYEDDSIFTNEEDDPIDNPSDLFGANIHLHFGELSNDPDIVYVRNYRDLTDYEITRIHNAYSVVVMGEEPKKKASPRGKKKLPDETIDSD